MTALTRGSKRSVPNSSARASLNAAALDEATKTKHHARSDGTPTSRAEEGLAGGTFSAIDELIGDVAWKFHD